MKNDGLMTKYISWNEKDNELIVYQIMSTFIFIYSLEIVDGYNSMKYRIFLTFFPYLQFSRSGNLLFIAVHNEPYDIISYWRIIGYRIYAQS